MYFCFLFLLKGAIYDRNYRQNTLDCILLSRKITYRWDEGPYTTGKERMISFRSIDRYALRNMLVEDP